jgi:SAM-dependent methyltransferase
MSTLATSPLDQASATAPDFDRLAHIYRWMEWFSFGPFLQRSRCAFLPLLRQCRLHRVLVIGDGDGRFTRRLLDENPSINIDAVDASQAMLTQLLRNAGPCATSVRPHCSDARIWKPPSTRYDLIATHFFLDCLSTPEVTALASRLRTCLAPDALWLISEFSVPRDWFGRFLAQPIVSSLYAAFRLLTKLEIRDLPDHRRALADAGFVQFHQKRFLHGLLTCEVWKLRAETDLPG